MIERSPDPPCQPVIPEPWRHNPSQWPERILIASMAVFAGGIAVYMGCFQWGLITSVWDPVFHEQSSAVLTSEVSHRLYGWFRVPDSIMGALAYLADAILAMAGSTRRWQFRPWLIALFGLSVLPLGGVSIALVVFQAVVVKAWCLLCLITATLSLVLAMLAVDEVWSSALYVRRLWKKTRNPRICWHAFWGRPSAEAIEVGESMSRSI